MILVVFVDTCGTGKRNHTGALVSGNGRIVLNCITWSECFVDFFGGCRFWFQNKADISLSSLITNKIILQLKYILSGNIGENVTYYVHVAAIRHRQLQ